MESKFITVRHCQREWQVHCYRKPIFICIGEMKGESNRVGKENFKLQSVCCVI